MRATMRAVEAAEKRKKAFGRAVGAALDGRSRSWLGAEVARRIGQDSPITQSAVTQWIAGATEPTPDKVFAIEKVLGRQPGSLSRLLGYLPVGAQPITSVTEAVLADPRLPSEELRAAVVRVYEAVAQRNGVGDGADHAE